jgi:hypothetical protein
MTKTELWKYLLIGASGIYLYHAFKDKKENGSLSGPQINSNKVVQAAMPFININPMFKPFLAGAAESILKEVTGENEIIDVTPIRK